MTSNHLLFLGLGTALLVAAWFAWTGRWRKWAQDMTVRPYPITLAPGMGLAFFWYGISPLLSEPVSLLGGLVAFTAGLAGFVLALWDPHWFGPRWSRWRDEVRKRAAKLQTFPPPPGDNSEVAARRAHDGQPLLACRWAALLGPDWNRPTPLRLDDAVPGRLLFYPSELVFAAEPPDDMVRGGPTVLSLPATAITEVRRITRGTQPEGHGWPPHLGRRYLSQVLIGTGEQAWLVETARPRRLVADVNAHYLAPRYA